MPIEPVLDDQGNIGDLSDTQSYSWILVNWIFQELKNDPFFNNFMMTRLVRALPVASWEHVPFLGVYLNDEQFTSDGPINMTDIGFVHNVPISMQIILRHNNAETLLKYLDQTSWFIMRNLFRKDALTNRLHSQLPANTRIEGVRRGRIRDRWGLTGSANETPLGERQLDMTFSFKTDWEPYGFPYLERMTFVTGFPGPGSTPEEQEKIQQVTMVFKFDPPDHDYTPPPYPPDPP